MIKILKSVTSRQWDVYLDDIFIHRYARKSEAEAFVFKMKDKLSALFI